MREGRLATVICVLCVGIRITEAVPVEVESQSELKDNGDGLTGPQPSVLGSVDKVFKQVTNFDQYQCLQKMICQFMGAAGDTVTNAVTNSFNNNNNGQQFVQSGQQFVTTGQQLVQNQYPNQFNQFQT